MLAKNKLVSIFCLYKLKSRPVKVRKNLTIGGQFFYCMLSCKNIPKMI